MPNLTPKVSIITAAFNADKYILDCIESIRNQSYRNIEYIIIDGGSSDNTIKLVEQNSECIDYFICEPDNGIYDAWNKGVNISTGDWIAFVGADDILYPNAIELYVNHIVSQPHKQLEFISSNIELVENDLTLIKTVGARWQWELFRKNMITYHLGCFHSRKLFTKYGLFDTKYQISGDYEFLLRAKETLCASYLDEITAKMRVGGVSNKFLYKAIQETYRAKVKNKILSPSQAFLLTHIDKLRIKYNI